MAMAMAMAMGNDQPLLALIQHPYLVSVSNLFKSNKEQKVSFCPEEEPSAHTSGTIYVYIFQREYATVDPALVHYVGTDEATTCVGIVIRNRKSRMTSVAHMDFTKIVDGGFNQMMSQLVGPDVDAEFDVHVIGAFEDSPPQVWPETLRKLLVLVAQKRGYSFSLCTKIVETLMKRPEKFHIQTLFVLGDNTQLDFEGHARPVFTGYFCRTTQGTSRCPDDIVRRIRLTAAHKDLAWDGKLLETYDTVNDRFVIAPCRWTRRKKQIAKTLQKLSDTDILFTRSTSPFAEASDFVENERRKWEYFIKHPEWEESFPQKKPHVFERKADGSWRKRLV